MDTQEESILLKLTANYVFLSQFELARASLHDLHKLNPRLSLDFLKTIIRNGGNIPGVLYSSSVPTPSHLAWLSVAEHASLCGDMDRVMVLEAEFELYIAMLIQSSKNDFPVKSKFIDDAVSSHGFEEEQRPLTEVLFSLKERNLWGLPEARQTINELQPGGQYAAVGKQSSSDGYFDGLKEYILDHSDVFDALCHNVANQLSDRGTSSSATSAESYFFQNLIQKTQLTAVSRLADEGRLTAATSRLRYVNEAFGTLEDSQYRKTFQNLLRHIQKLPDQEESQSHLTAVHEAVLATERPKLAYWLNDEQDQMIHKEAIMAAKGPNPQIVPPLQKLVLTLNSIQSQKGSAMDDSVDPAVRTSDAIKTCLRELFHFCRVEKKHSMACVMEAALSLVKKKEFNSAKNLLASFPSIRPLVVAMGWDLLSGDTGGRKELARAMWNDYTPTEPQNLTVALVHDLCNQFGYRLDLAEFMSDYTASEEEAHRMRQRAHSGHRQGMVEAKEFAFQYVLERLAVHSPVMVLLDIVPTLPLERTIHWVARQPLEQDAQSLFRRRWDVELLQMSGALSSIVAALSAMERCSPHDETDRKKAQTHLFVAQQKFTAFEAHMKAISTVPRKIWILGFIRDLLHMDSSLSSQHDSARVDKFGVEESLVAMLSMSSSRDFNSEAIVDFTQTLLAFLSSQLPSEGQEMEGALWMFQQQAKFDSLLPPPPPAAAAAAASLSEAEIRRMALPAWREKTIQLSKWLEEWSWRLSVVKKMTAKGSLKSCMWFEVISILRAAPSTLLNMCVQGAEYSLGEEAVHRFHIPPEEEASLQLAEWLDVAVTQASVDGAVSRVAEGQDSPDFAKLQPSLTSVMLCGDVAATSTKASGAALQALKQARSILSKMESNPEAMEVSPGNLALDRALRTTVKKLLQRLLDIQSKDRSRPLQVLLSDFSPHTPNSTLPKVEPRVVARVYRIIEECHEGKPHFLSGKIHNLVRALSSSDLDSADDPTLAMALKWTEPKAATATNGLGLGLGLGATPSLPPVSPRSSTSSFPTSPMHRSAPRPIRMQGSAPSGTPTSPTGSPSNQSLSGYRSHGVPVSVDVALTAGHAMSRTSSLGSGLSPHVGPTNQPRGYLAAFLQYVAQLGEAIDGADTNMKFNYFSLVYEQPPDILNRLVFDLGTFDVAARVATIMNVDLVHHAIVSSVPPVVGPSDSHSWAQFLLPLGDNSWREGRVSAPPAVDLRPLKLDVVKKLFEKSPLRTIVACLFESVWSGSHDLLQFALENSQSYPALHRWIDMQADFQQVESITAEQRADMRRQGKVLKRSRSQEEDGHGVESHDDNPSGRSRSLACRPILFSWERTADTEAAILKLMSDGKLEEALSMADKWLPQGPSDALLQALMESVAGGRDRHRDGSHGQHGGTLSRRRDTWRLCIRIRDKEVSAAMALKYMQDWELEHVKDVLLLCDAELAPSSHLSQELKSEMQLIALLEGIVNAVPSMTWQQAKESISRDPESLASELASKGAIDVAMQIIGTQSVGQTLLREYQGRQLCTIMSGDPAKGQGAARGLSFLDALPAAEESVLVALSAIHQMDNLRHKQLLTKFVLKRRQESLHPVQRDYFQKLLLGLDILQMLPKPWQQRCSQLQQLPSHVVESLLMWKQIKLVQKIFEAFPSTRSDDLVSEYAAKALACPSSMAAIGAQPSPTHSTTLSWQVLTGDPNVDYEIRSSHRYDNCPSASYFMAVASLFSTDSVVIQSAASILFDAIRRVSLPDDLPVQEVGPAMRRALHCLVQYSEALQLLRSEISKFQADESELPYVLVSDDLAAMDNFQEGAGEAEFTFGWNPSDQSMASVGSSPRLVPNPVPPLASITSTSTAGSRMASESSSHGPGSVPSLSGTVIPPLFSSLAREVKAMQGKVALLRSLLCASVRASWHHLQDEESARRFRDALIDGERYQLAIQVSNKCTVSAAPVWTAWGYSLLKVMKYSEAREKFRHAIKSGAVDPTELVKGIVATLEAKLPVNIDDAAQVCESTKRSAHEFSQDALSPESFFDILNYTASTRTSRLPCGLEDVPLTDIWAEREEALPEPLWRCRLDAQRYDECMFYLNKYAPREVLPFLFRHAHAQQACQLFFPADSIPAPPKPPFLPSGPQKPDALATEFGTIEELASLCVAYDAVPTLEQVILGRGAGGQGSHGSTDQIWTHTTACLGRICSFFESQHHFNHLYRFQLLLKDKVAAGLTCVQLFLYSTESERAVQYLQQAKVHFEEEYTARQTSEHGRSRVIRGGKKSGAKVTDDELIRLKNLSQLQVEVIHWASNLKELPWVLSLFGSPNEADTLERRCRVAELLLERNFTLAEQIILELDLPKVHVCAGVVASLAERRRTAQMLDLLRQKLRQLLSEDEWDKVLLVAIRTYMAKYGERQERLIDRIVSKHNKVLAYVICGRLRQAFQVASEDNNESDVMFVCNEASARDPVRSLCHEWLLKRGVRIRN